MVELDPSGKSASGEEVEPTEEFEDGYLEWLCAEKVGVGGAELSDAVHEVHELSLEDVNCVECEGLSSS